MKGKHKSSHKEMHRARGGAAEKPDLVSGNPNVIREAEEKKKGGKVVGKIGGHSAKHRLDRVHHRGRKSGGRVGADKSPLSSAHSETSAAREPD